MKTLLRVSAIVRTLYIRVKDLYEIVLSVSYWIFITFFSVSKFIGKLFKMRLPRIESLSLLQWPWALCESQCPRCKMCLLVRRSNPGEFMDQDFVLHSSHARTQREIVSTLSTSRWEQAEGWARTQRASSYVWRQTTAQKVREVLSLARSQHRTVVLLGRRHSYHDAALNGGGVTIDLSQMRRVLAWDPEQGVVKVEPGVTIGDVWRATMADGWWFVVAPGTMSVNLGGCLSMNVHGRNAWKKGSIGEHVLAIELLLASGDLITLTPSSDPELFQAVIGGLGMIGIITSITLQLRPIQSGRLLMYQRPARLLSEMFAIFAEEAAQADYLEGWIDGYANKRRLGCGLVTCARFIDEPEPQSLLPSIQVTAGIGRMIQPQFLGRLMRPFLAIESRLGNTIYYRHGVLRRSRPAYHISLVQFHFRSEDILRFLRVLLPAGVRTIQPFVPSEQAPAVFTELLERSRRMGLVPMWCCFKQHRADPFLLSCQVDGFSLELNYAVSARAARNLTAFFTEMRDLVVAAGGRLYLAKDDVLDAGSYARSMGMDRIEHFLAVKRAYDPEGLFQSALFQRIFTQDLEA